MAKTIQLFSCIRAKNNGNQHDCRYYCLSGFLELTVVKFRIESVLSKKLFVITDLYNPALIHYQNGIGIFIVDNL